MNRCYRTPRQILSVAHAINMGLLREGGPLQSVTSKEDWTALGYQVVEGDFSATSVKLGASVVLRRPDTTSGHPIDNPKFDASFDRGTVLSVHISHNQADDVAFIARSIQRDLESGLKPEDIAVVSLDPVYILKSVEQELLRLDIKSLALNDANRDHFREEGRVTLSSIRRAKGNEAYKVYALNLHRAGGAEVSSNEGEMVSRNQVFVALTRTKLWCVAVGRPGALMQELVAAAEQGGYYASRLSIRLR